ncbi:MAG: outer membrane beta-barrel protein [candidate division Zixibacteria bacterium]|nr:outer membrane beta-barrel protein [candidate division Zixibacteria bacterium]
MTKTLVTQRLATLAVCAGLLLATQTVNAQGPSAPSLKPKIYLGGGIPFISNPNSFKDDFNPSYTLMAAVGLPLNVGIELMGKFHYHKFSQSDASKLQTTDPNAKILYFGVDAKWSFAPPASPAKPFFLIGAGTFSYKNDATTTLAASLPVDPRISDSDIYFNLGVGMDVKIGPSFAFFVEGKYTILNTPIQSTGLFPIIVGFRIM